jgi:DNA polymerase-3 subunit delta'
MLARILAAQLLNIEEAKLDLHPNFLSVSSEGSISKEQIDETIAKLQLSAFGGGYKIVIMEDAHAMTTAAANAFLKTLEEPSGQTLLILITSELSKILPTVISRSVVLNFKPVAQNSVADLLRGQNAAEAKLLSKISFGRPGYALQISQNADWQNNNRANVKEFCNLFFAAPSYRWLAAINIFGAKKENAKTAVLERTDLWLELIRDMIFIKYDLNDSVAHSYDYAALERAASGKSARDLAVLGGRIIKMRELAHSNINSQMLLENLII